MSTKKRKTSGGPKAQREKKPAPQPVENNTPGNEEKKPETPAIKPNDPSSIKERIRKMSENRDNQIAELGGVPAPGTTIADADKRLTWGGKPMSKYRK